MDCPNIVKGMRDILPPDSAYWSKIEQILLSVVHQFGYGEIRTPILEAVELFKRSVGDVTDIVEKEMYAFIDQGQQQLCMRPEGTASTVRALLNQKVLNKNPEQRLWYIGPNFRRERPQKGRYRQFEQFGVEAFGFAGPEIDVEQIQLVETIWQRLGLSDHVCLEINSLGDTEARAAYRTALQTFYRANESALDEDAKRRLDTNPLRLLDSKNPDMIELNQQAPKLLDYLKDDCKAHFAKVCEYLDDLGIVYTINPFLVRGLDYYTRTVFEWKSDLLGAQSTVCAGGHYDGLVSLLGGPDTPACGFAMGVDRLVLVCESLTDIKQDRAIDLFFIAANDEAKRLAWQYAAKLRQRLPSIRIVVDAGAGKFKQQFKRADRAAATLAAVIAEEELAQQKITVKFLREDKPQQMLSFSELEALLSA